MLTPKVSKCQAVTRKTLPHVPVGLLDFTFQQLFAPHVRKVRFVKHFDHVLEREVPLVCVVRGVHGVRYYELTTGYIKKNNISGRYHITIIRKSALKYDTHAGKKLKIFYE